MLHIYQFEIFENEGVYLAFPFDMEGGAQGCTFAEAIENAYDWLKIEMEHRAENNLDYPIATLNNSPQNGGMVVTLCLEANKDATEHKIDSGQSRILDDSQVEIAQFKLNDLEHSNKVSA